MSLVFSLLVGLLFSVSSFSTPVHKIVRQSQPVLAKISASRTLCSRKQRRSKTQGLCLKKTTATNGRVVKDSVAEQAQKLAKSAPNLNKNVLKLALIAYKKAVSHGGVKKPVLTVIDYSKASTQPRFWVFDLKRQKLLYNTYVAHGRNSGGTYAKHFSNQASSKSTSLGTFITKNTYFGHKGYSLNIQGLEPGINDHALARRVVIHGAWYVNPGFIKSAGSAGRSWGCPAIPTSMVSKVINTIKNGSVMFSYFPDKKFLSKSRYVTA